MDQDQDQDQYRDFLTMLVTTSKLPIVHGKTIIFLWRDEAHLQEWMQGRSVESDDVRIAMTPSSFLTMLETGEENRDDVCILALGLGVKEDYSDVRCVYYMVTQRND
jgi:hypothetical protein